MLKKILWALAAALLTLSLGGCGTLSMGKGPLNGYNKEVLAMMTVTKDAVYYGKITRHEKEVLREIAGTCHVQISEQISPPAETNAVVGGASAGGQGLGLGVGSYAFPGTNSLHYLLYGLSAGAGNGAMVLGPMTWSEAMVQNVGGCVEQRLEEREGDETNFKASHDPDLHIKIEISKVRSNLPELIKGTGKIPASYKPGPDLFATPKAERPASVMGTSAPTATANERAIRAEKLAQERWAAWRDRELASEKAQAEADHKRLEALWKAKARTSAQRKPRKAGQKHVIKKNEPKKAEKHLVPSSKHKESKGVNVFCFFSSCPSN